MSLFNFIHKYDGKGIDFDGAFSTQCVDLYRQYVKEVLGYPQSPPVVGAKDIWDTYLPDFYRRVENTPHGIPDRGDIVIFGTGLGKFGHVSVFIDGSATRFTSFDQNYPNGSLCHTQGHTYNGVLGWLQPLNKETDMPEWLTKLLQENNITVNNEGKIREIFGKAKDYDDKVRGLTEQVKSANESLADKALEVSILTGKVTNLENKVMELEEQFNQVRSERDQATWENTKLQASVKTLESDISGLQAEVAKHKENNNVYAYSWKARFISLFKGGE